VGDRLDERHALQCQAARLLPQWACLLGLLRLRVVVRQQLGLGLGDVREHPFETFGNASMKRASRLPKQRPISRILYEGVLEQVGCMWRHALPK
jgi:hypothetical protein